MASSYSRVMDKAKSLASTLIVAPGSRVDIAKIDPRSTPGISGKIDDDAKAKAEKRTRENVERIAALQEKLFAEGSRALLVVLQGTDTSGKDGVVRNVFGGVNPAGCVVTSFKRPSERELDQDFLWRVHQAAPTRGMIGVFNRSHYEDVLVVRVHGFVPEKVWKTRYESVNAFEKLLVHEGTTILKFMLHISKEEQLERLKARVADPDKRWKFNPQDLKERELWSEYAKAYGDVLAKCSTAHAPWHVVPADRKWYRNWAISTVVREALEKMDPKPAKADWDPKSVKFV